MIQIERDDPQRADVLELLQEHLADMFSIGPAESVHALDPAEFTAPGISFWSAREDGLLLGCGARKRLPSGQGEIKSMRTTATARGRGIAALLLSRIVDVSRDERFEDLYLETGTQPEFAPARRLYYRHGFTDCEPFGHYSLDPNSVFMRLSLVRAAVH